MQRCRLLLCLLLLPASPLIAQDGEADIDRTSLDNVRLVVDRGTHTGEARNAVFSSDGKRLFTFGRDRTVQVWNTETGRRERMLRLPANLFVRAGFGQIGMGMAISPDNHTLAVAGGERAGDVARGERHPALLINLDTGSFRTLTGVNATCRDLAFSPDGKLLAAAHNGKAEEERAVHVWDVAAGGSPRALRSHEGTVRGLAFSSTGLLATACDDNKVRIWDLDRRRRVRALIATLPHTAGVRDVAWAPDGKHLATVAAGSVHYWAADGQKPIRSFGTAELGATCREASSVTLGELGWGKRPDALLVSWYANVPGRGGNAGGASLLDVETGKATEGYKTVLGRHFPDVPLAMSADGKWAVIVYGDLIALWPTDAPQKSRLLGEAAPFPGDIGWGEDNRTIAWGGNVDEVERESKLGPLTHALSLSTLEIRSSKDELPDVHNTSRKLPGWERTLRGGEVAVWQKGKKVYERPGNSNSMPTLLPQQGGGALLALHRGKKFELIDPLQDKVLRSFPEPLGHPFRLCASPDGNYLLMATRDQRLLIYSVKTAEHLLSLFVAGDDWVAWTKGGYYAASPGGERMMGWSVQEKPDHLPTFHPAARFRERLHRPDVIRLILAKGSLKDAMAAVKASARGPADLGKLLPPQLARLDVDTSKPGQVTVKAVVEAAVSEQPVTALQLILDGRPAPISNDRKTFAVPVKQGAQAEAQWTLKLPPGSHRVAVLAAGPDTSAVYEATREVLGPAAPPRAQGKLHLLCVGVSEYAHDGKGDENQGLNLKYAAKDAAELLTVFKGCQGDGKLFEPGAVTLLTNSQATSKAVLAELQKLVDASPDPGDLVVLHFSGHGERDDEGKLWLLTHEADRRKPLKETCLSGETLKDLLAEIPCRVLLILDACHSGALGRPSVSNDLTAMLADESCGVFVLVAARGREYALEGVKVPINGRETQLQNGLFTWALREALQGKARPDPYDSRVYTHHIYDHVFSEVRQWSGGKQHPYLGTPWGSKPLPLVWRDR